jgi:hypothetical protein
MKKIIIVLLMFVLGVNLVVAAPIISVSLLNQDPDPVAAGGEVELRFKVENIGDTDAKNFEFELIPKYPFSLVPGESAKTTKATLSSVESGDNALIVKHKVKIHPDAIEGDTKLKIRSKSSSTGEIIQDFEVSISSKDKIEISKVSLTKLNPGKETDIIFSLTNIGATPLKNIVFSWNEEDNLILPVGSDNKKYINNLGVGEKYDLKYKIVADTGLTAGLYALKTTIEYQDKAATEIVESNIGIVVGGETDFDVTFSESSQGQTSLSVANVGSNPALSVTVRVPEQENFMVQGSSASIVGNLDMGDYTIVSFQIGSGRSTSSAGQIEGTSQEERQQLRQRFSQTNEISGQERSPRSGRDSDLKVLIEYTDTTGTRQSLEKKVPIQFRDISAQNTANQRGSFGGRQQQSSFLSDKRVYIPLLIFVLGIGWYVYYRKREYLTKVTKLFKK